MTDFRVKVSPPTHVTERRLRRRIGQITNLRVPNRKASIFLDRWVQLNFRTEGGNVGGWEPIQRAGVILQDTGRLRASFLPFSDAGDAGIGSELPYSRVHDEGLGNVRQRRILPEDSDVSNDLFKIYDKHVEGLTRRKL